uniref:Uncharacterized protein n=1 Tax=Nelumbo nucifera TaxID=4432 RepID=A0A822XL39_NELNU|nr:TPA_asm: hypothetical protein HUJ06_021324 [Nelumbo nucifera]
MTSFFGMIYYLIQLHTSFLLHLYRLRAEPSSDFLQLKDMLDISRHPHPVTARSDFAAGSHDAYPRTPSVDLNDNN